MQWLSAFFILLHFAVNIESNVSRIQLSSDSLLCKIRVNACMNNKGFFLQFKYTHTHEITFDEERIND